MIETRVVLGKEVNIILPLKVMTNETDPVTLYGKGLSSLRTIQVAGPALKKDVNYRLSVVETPESSYRITKILQSEHVNNITNWELAPLITMAALEMYLSKKG